MLKRLTIESRTRHGPPFVSGGKETSQSASFPPLTGEAGGVLQSRTSTVRKPIVKRSRALHDWIAHTPRRESDFAPKWQPQISPGQRPGDRSPTLTRALKGRDQCGCRPLYRPFRARVTKRSLLPQGVALGCHVAAPSGRQMTASLGGRGVCNAIVRRSSKHRTAKNVRGASERRVSRGGDRGRQLR
jgi:hypothetical protein